MFNKKIIFISFLSFLLITGSSYFIFCRKKNNNDEVNIVDNSDNSINEEESINEVAESSSSFLFVVIIIVIIIIAIAIFFFIFYRKKFGIENEEGLEEQESYVFYKSCQIVGLKDKIEELTAKRKNIENLVDEIIENMKNDCNNAIEGNLPKEQLPKDYLVDFYYTENDRNIITKNVPVDNDNVSIFMRNGRRVRDITVYKDDYKYVVVNLFAAFLEAAQETEGFNELLNNINTDYKRTVCLFIAVIIEPFLEYVRKKRRNVRFISSIEAAIKNCTVSFDCILDILEKKVVNEGNKIRVENLSSITGFIKGMKKDRYLFFSMILNKLINQCFLAESKRLLNISNKK